MQPLIDVTSDGVGQLAKVFSLFEKNTTMKGYRLDGNRMILYWAESKEAKATPFPFSMEFTVSSIDNWLKVVEYGNEPDHDGSNHKGWRVYNEDYGHVDGEWQAFVAIMPAWIEYGK